MNEKPIKKQSFLQGTAILAMATIIVKLMGFLFKTPLNYIIGEQGSSYFYNAYKVYDVLLMISTTGLPVAVSRMIAEAQELGNYAQIRRIFRTALYVFLAIGIVGSCGMLIFCKQLSVMVSTNENSFAAIAALAPCVLLICLISAYRGFFQGQRYMSPTSFSQILEALTRLAVGLSVAYIVMKKTGSVIYAAGGAIMGVTMGCLISVLYLNHKFRGAYSALPRAGGSAKSGRSTLRELLSIAVPITLGAAGLQIINLVDTMIYMRRLTGALGWSAAQVDTANGIYSFQQTIFALPCAFIPTITIACIPAVAAALTRKDAPSARATEESALRTMGLIAMPCAAGLFVLAQPIVRLLCPGYGEASVATATPILAILGVTVIFNSMVLLLNAFMQAHGDGTTPVINMLAGGVVKVVVNFILVGIPALNIVGAPIGTLVCYVCITVLDLITMRKSVTTRPVILKNLVRPFLAAAIMGGATYMVYHVLANVLGSMKLACLIALVFAVIVYFILVVALRCVTYEDCLLLPKGEKIAKILRIREKS